MFVESLKEEEVKNFFTKTYGVKNFPKYEAIGDRIYIDEEACGIIFSYTLMDFEIKGNNVDGHNNENGISILWVRFMTARFGEEYKSQYHRFTFQRKEKQI